MGYSVLYIAFGIVALWLLGEVLLQYKARLRWRLLAFAGFMGVAGGVALREVVVILLGAAAFGTGQTFVTLSHRRGFSDGWALRGRPGAGRGAAAAAGEPTLAVTPVEESHDDTVGGGQEVLAERDDAAEVYRPVPMSDDSGDYPLYDGHSSYTPDPYTSGGYEGYGAHGYAGWSGDPQPAPAAASYEAYGSGYAEGGWGGRTYGYEQAGSDFEGAGFEGQPATAGYDAGGAGDAAGTGGTETAGTAGAYDTGSHGTGSYDTGGYDTGGYDTGGYRYDGFGGVAWPDQEHREPYPAAPGGPGYDPRAQPYIPQQQHQPAYEQTGAQEPSPPQYASDHDPYDPYRY